MEPSFLSLDKPKGAGLPRFWEPPFVISATFLFFIFARYIVLGARRDWLAPLRIEFLLGMILGVVCIYLVSGQGFNYSRAKFIMVSIGMLFVCMVVQLPFAADPDRAQFIMTERVLKFAIVTFLMTVLIHSPRMMEWFLLSFLFACFYVTQESVRGLISGSLIWENQGVQRLHGAVRMYAHPNSLAGLALGTVPFIIFLMPVIKDWKKRGLMLGTLATSMICVVFSGSRTSYVGLVIFILFWWAVSRSKGKFLVVALLVTIVAIPILPDQYIGRFKAVLGDEAEGNSRGTRIEILNDAIQIFQENPMGVGVASFPAVRSARFGRVQDTHNLYLEVATNLGVQGVLAFGFLMVSILGACRKTHQSFGLQLKKIRVSIRDPEIPRDLKRPMFRLARNLLFLQAVAKATAGFLIIRLVLGFFGMDLYEPYWWFAAGLGINLMVLEGWTSRNLAQMLASIKPLGV